MPATIILLATRVMTRYTAVRVMTPCLVVLIMMLSYLFTKLGIYLFPSGSPVVIKLVVDSCLFLFSFTVQRMMIFSAFSKLDKNGAK